MINNYLKEFQENPNGIEEYKITILKDHYYKYVNYILQIEKNNFQIGVNSNFKLLFFRDKLNPSKELVLNLTEEKTFLNYRREISYSINSIKLDKKNSENTLETKNLLDASINELNIHTNLNRICCKNNCIIT